MTATAIADQRTDVPAGPDGWRPDATALGPADPATPPNVPPPDDAPPGGGGGPRWGPQRPSGWPAVPLRLRAVGAGLLLVGVLGAVWPAFALSVLAGVTAALLLRLGLRWVAPARSGLRRPPQRRLVRGLAAAVAFSAAAGVLLAPLTTGWVAGVVLAVLLAAACVAVLTTSVRQGQRRVPQAIAAVLGLAVLAVPVVLPSAALALSAATVVLTLALSGTVLLTGARVPHPRLLR